MNSIPDRTILRVVGMAIALVVLAIPSFSQTVLPPIAEYHGRAEGMVELRNDGDIPLAVLVSAKGFTVDEEGHMLYTELDPSVTVDFGSSSFVIPPRQSHMVFYKAKISKPPYWFAILSTFTKATPVKNEIRVNVVLPHVVYLYQKHALKKQDVELALDPGEKQGSVRLEVRNKTDKAGRVETVECKGFEKEALSGGIPVFPNKSRFLTIETGTPHADARCKVNFEEGFSLETMLRR